MTEAIGNSFIPRRAKYYYQEMMYAASLTESPEDMFESIFTLAQLGVIKHNTFEEVWLHAR